MSMDETGMNGDMAVSGSGQAQRERAVPVVASTSRRMRVLCGERDQEVLRWAHEQKFLLYDQVARFYPEGPPNPHVPRKATVTSGMLRRRRRPGSLYMQERLRKLVRYGILERVPVFTEAASALIPGETGFRLLEGLGLSRGLARLDQIDWKNFLHDRAATDVRWILEKRHGGVWTPERVLRRELDARHVPDAMVRLGERVIALEVELTRKSQARYQAIFNEYVSWSATELNAVLYVVPGREELAHLFRSVLPAVLASEKVWGSLQPDLSRFRFTTIAALSEPRTWWTRNTPESPAMGSLS